MYLPGTKEKLMRNPLPLKRSVKFVYFNAIALALLMAGVSLSGILFREAVYPGEDIIAEFVPNDFLNLLLGVPVLLITLILMARQRLIGLLSIPGILFYIIYVYSTYLLALPFNENFLPYLILVTLSLYTLIALIAAIDTRKAQSMIEGHVPVRSAGIILFAIACILLIYQVYSMIRALVMQSGASQVMTAQWIVDFVIASPPVLITGILMIRRTALGYTAGTGILLLLSMLFIGLIPVILVKASLTSAPVAVTDLLIISVSSLICLVPFAMFVRGILRLSGTTGQNRTISHHGNTL